MCHGSPRGAACDVKGGGGNGSSSDGGHGASAGGKKTDEGSGGAGVSTRNRSRHNGGGGGAIATRAAAASDNSSQSSVKIEAEGGVGDVGEDGVTGKNLDVFVVPGDVNKLEALQQSLLSGTHTQTRQPTHPLTLGRETASERERERRREKLLDYVEYTCSILTHTRRTPGTQHTCEIVLSLRFFRDSVAGASSGARAGAGTGGVGARSARAQPRTAARGAGISGGFGSTRSGKISGCGKGDFVSASSSCPLLFSLGWVSPLGPMLPVDDSGAQAYRQLLIYANHPPPRHRRCHKSYCGCSGSVFIVICCGRSSRSTSSGIRGGGQFEGA